MSNELFSTLVKVLGPLAGIIFILVVPQRRGLPREEIGVTLPSAREFALWIVVWLFWMWLGEIIIDRLGMPDPGSWPAYSALIIFLRILAIGLLGPALEELVFRGVLFARVRRTRLGAPGAVILLAIGWALLHVQYGAATIAMIAVDGVILGVARWRSGSVLVPIAMHVLGNLYSISQSLQQ